MKFSGSWDPNNLNDDNKCKKNMKKMQVLIKNAKVHVGKNMQNNSITTRNYAIIYKQTFYQALEEVS